MSWIWQKKGDISYLTLPKWREEGIDVGFSSRSGGVSQAPFDTLNLALHVGDDRAAVLENRKRWLETWGVSWTGAAAGEQTHGTLAAWLTEEDGGKGIREPETAIPVTDALLTKSALALMGFFADCVPVFFYFPDIRAVGIAHAGWKGTANRIGEKVLKAAEEAGGRAEKAWVAIGPSIGPCCYLGNEEMADQFRMNFQETPFLMPQEGNQYLFDLWEANKLPLLERGVRPENIDLAGLCTEDNPECFFSYRREKEVTGRMAGWIRLARS